VTKKQNTIYGVVGLVLGIVGGIAGTAFSMGAEQQYFKDKIVAIETHQNEHTEQVEKEMDRYAEIIAAHITQLQTTIAQLTTTVGDLRTDVSVLKALMERMEQDMREKSDSP